MEYLKIEQSSEHPLLVECQKVLMDLIWQRGGLPRSGTLLDIGPGKAFYSRIFRKWGLQVSCLDIDPSLRDLYEQLGCEFKQCDLRQEKLPYSDESFDVIWCSHIIEHLHNPVEFVTECVRVLKPGAALVVRTPDLMKVRFDFWNDPTHVQPFMALSLQKILHMTGLQISYCGNCELPAIRGLHRLRAYRWMPGLLWRGNNLLGIGRKNLIEQCPSAPPHRAATK